MKYKIVRQLVDINCKFEIQGEKKDSVELKRDLFIDWYLINSHYGRI